MFNFLRTEYIGGYGALAEAMARWQAAQVSATSRSPHCLRCFFQIFYHWPGRFLRQTDVKPFRLSRCVCRGAGAMYSAIGHRIWGGLRKHKRWYRNPAQANDLRRIK